MLITSSRQRAEAHIRRAVASGQGPWPALDAYRLHGGRSGWKDWFRLWKQISHKRTNAAGRQAVSGRSAGDVRRPRYGQLPRAGRPGGRIGIR